MITSIEIQYAIACRDDNFMLKEIGGTHPNGIIWKISLERAIRAIETNEWKFHVEIDNERKAVSVIKLRGGSKTLGIVLNKDPALALYLTQFISPITHKTSKI